MPSASFVLASHTGGVHPIDPNGFLVSLTVVMLLVAGAGLLAIRLRTRPGAPRPVPVADPGPETPALVDLLLGGFRVEDDAVPATLVDLAARDHVVLGADGSGGVVVAPGRATSDDLTRYEERVLGLVRSRTTGGSAPAAALTTGTSDRWFRSFTREVNAHGRRLGLCRRRYGWGHLGVAWVLTALPWAVGWFTVATADRVEETSGWANTESLVLMGALLAVSGLTWTTGRLTRSDAQADTPEGLDAAGRWLAVRDQLHEQGVFDEASATDVATWGRHLAYATATGIAPEVERQLPFDTEHDKHAWSLETGRWRRVRVRYLALRPGWGQPPWRVAFEGALRAAVAGAIAWVAWQVASDAIELDSLDARQRDIAGLVALVVTGLAGAAATYSAIRAAAGILDLVPRRTVEGEVVRRRIRRTGHRLPKPVQWLLWSGRDHQTNMRRDQNRRTHHHLAVDDGTDDRIVAFRVRPEIFGQAYQSARVRLKVSPLLGYVTSIEELRPPRSPGGGGRVAHELVEELAGHASRAVDGAGDALRDKLAQIEDLTDEHGRPVLDQTDDEGVPLRQRLEEAQRQLRGVSHRADPTGTRDAQGNPLVAGLFDQLGGVLGGLAESADRAQRPPPPPPDADRPDDPDDSRS